MINAGVSISTFNGLQMWDGETKQWKGIGVRVTYPDDQSIANNPIEPDDYLIEPSGNVWKVVKAEIADEATNSFTLDLSLTNKEPSGSLSPSLGSVRVGIITPVNGYMAPYWDPSVVSSTVGRITAYMTMKNIGAMVYADTPGETLV